MVQQSADRSTDLLKHALFDAIERAQDLAVRAPPANAAALKRRLKAIGRAGAEICAVTEAMQVIERCRR